MIKNKYLLFLSFFIGFLFWGSGLVFALEAKLPGLKDNPTLPEYVKYLFTFGISLAAILALISFTVGAVQLIISGDSPETSSNAKDRMKGSVLGLVLALSSFLILQTINPELLNLRITPVFEVPIAMSSSPPGVYYYLRADCTGNNFYVNTFSGKQIDDQFAGKIKGVKIINAPNNNIFYGVLFHEQSDANSTGRCLNPIMLKSRARSGCITVSNPSYTHSANVFIWNKNNLSSPSGEGVSFYSEPYGYNEGAQNRGEGFCLFYNDEIGEIFTKKANKLSFNGGDCGYAEKTLTQYKNIYKTFQNRPGSIDIKGDYLVALFSDNNSGGPYCQTFNQDVPNLNMQTFIAAGHSIGDVYIIPIN